MRQVVKGIPRLFKGQKGFSLLETVVGVAILGFIGAGVIMAIDTNSRSSGILDEQVVGMNLATSYFEAIRKLPYDNNSPNEYPSAGDNIQLPPQYSISIDVDYSNDGENWVDIYDPFSSPAQTIQRITVIVSHGDKTVLSICTFRTEFYS